MSGLAAVGLALVLAALLIAALGKRSKKTLVGGFLIKGPNGALYLQLTPATRKKRNKR